MSNGNPLDLVECDLAAGAVVELGRAAMACEFSSVPPASRCGDAGRAEHVAAEFDFKAAFGCLVSMLFRGQSGPAPEQKDQNDDQQQQAEASSIVMIWGSIIEASATE